MFSDNQRFGRRATDVLELDGRAWRPMVVPPALRRNGGNPVVRRASLTTELEQRVAELERDNREMAAFAADVAHDLRAPLQAVTGFAELLARREGSRLDSTSQAFVGHILAAAGAMRELVEAVLEHRQSSSAPLSPIWVNATHLVATVVRRLQTELDSAGAVVNIAALPTVFVDRVQLGRVFQNLLANSLDAARPEEPVTISVTAERLGNAWEFAVIDNGVGVGSEDGARIFELFQRGGRDGQRSTGHGMGLAICRTIVERHGGRIAVQRAPGGGSCFSFTIPDRIIGTCRAGNADSTS